MKYKIGLIIILITGSFFSEAQSILDRNVSIEINHQRLENVLEILSNKENFFFLTTVISLNLIAL